MDIKCHFYKVILPVFMMVMVLLTGISCNSGGSSQPSESNESEMAETDFQEELVAVENDDSPTEEDIVREEQEQVVTDAAQVINNHFIALSQRDRQMLRNTVADVVTSYIGMSNVTPADIEKYMNSLHADGSQDIKYVIRHLSVNKETDGSTPCYKVHFTVTQITRQGDKTGEHTFAGLSEINNEGKITSLILSQQS